MPQTIKWNVWYLWTLSYFETKLFTPLLFASRFEETILQETRKTKKKETDKPQILLDSRRIFAKKKKKKKEKARNLKLKLMALGWFCRRQIIGASRPQIVLFVWCFCAVDPATLFKLRRSCQVSEARLFPTSRRAWLWLRCMMANFRLTSRTGRISPWQLLVGQRERERERERERVREREGESEWERERESERERERVRERVWERERVSEREGGGGRDLESKGWEREREKEKKEEKGAIEHAAAAPSQLGRLDVCHLDHSAGLIPLSSLSLLSLSTSLFLLYVRERERERERVIKRWRC